MPVTLLRPFPLFVLAAAAAAAGVVGFTVSAGIRDDMAVVSVIAVIAAAGTAWALARRPGFVALVDGPPALARTLFVLGSLAVAVQLAWLAPFIIDPNHSTWTPSALSPVPPTHSCISAYWMAGSRVKTKPDVG